MASLHESSLSSSDSNKTRKRKKQKKKKQRLEFEDGDTVDNYEDRVKAKGGKSSADEESLGKQYDYMACAILQNVTATHDTALSKVRCNVRGLISYVMEIIAVFDDPSRSR